jgi:hypothetical protein
MIIMTMMTTISVCGYKKAFTILLFVIPISIVTIIGVANALYNNTSITANQIYNTKAAITDVIMLIHYM